MLNLIDKDILFIVPKFFNYEKFIKSKMVDKGAEVYLIYENLEELNLFFRFICVYLKRFKKLFASLYYKFLLKKIKKSIDIVFVIRGSSLTPTILTILRKKYPEARFVMYQWDCIKNNENAELIEKYFDKCFTFDKIDAVNKNWIYRPLFFTKAMESIKKDIDVSYICSIHSERIQILNKLVRICDERKLSLFTHVFSKKIIYLKRKYINREKEYTLSDPKYIKFYSLKTAELFEIYARSKIIVDYTNPNQQGLTMRTIECIGNKCKLITNNKNLITEDFYDDLNYYIYNGTNIAIPDYLFSQPYHDINEEQYLYYSLDGWLATILGD